MRYAQLVIGPAGCGKSTYCSTMANHAVATKRIINVVNMDPAAEQFKYEALADIRDLIHIDDVMEDEDLRYGPNGGLVYCMEYAMENSDWLQEQLGDYDDDYILFDCPGQIELYTHLDIIRRLVSLLQSWDFRVCTVFLLDSQFMIESTKFLSGVMTALAAMVNLECPHVNILTKMDLVSKEAQKQIGRFVDPDTSLLMEHVQAETWNVRHQTLSEAFSKLIDSYSLVSFTPLNIKDEENISDLLISIDNAIQYGEDQDVKVRDIDEDDDEEKVNNSAEL